MSYMKNINIIFLLAIFIISGCALSPQIIEIDPVIEVDTAVVKPVKIRLDVVDARSSEIIGKRGGIYKETSDISTSKNMTSNLRHNLSKVLNKLGYQIANKSDSSDADLIVKITNINYSAYTEKLLNKVELKVAVDVIAHKNNKEFTGGFNATRKKDYVTVPGIEDNEVIVNETLAIVLQNMLKDNDLNKFLGS